MKLDVNLDGRVAFVTGAARGIGAALARWLMDHGAKVAGADLSWSSKPSDANFLALEMNLTDDASIKRAFAATIERFGTVDIIVNNASMRMQDVFPGGTINMLETTVEQWKRMYETNVIGSFNVIQTFSKPMIEKKRGSIINISSGSGADGMKGNQPYGSSKAALTNLSRSLSKELSGLNIAVNVVFPPSTDSTGARDRQRASGHTVPLLKPDATAPVVVFLAGCDASVTGRTFNAWHWNLEHGLGGMEVWASSEEDLANYKKKR